MTVNTTVWERKPGKRHPLNRMRSSSSIAQLYKREAWCKPTSDLHILGLGRFCLCFANNDSYCSSINFEQFILFKNVCVCRGAAHVLSNVANPVFRFEFNKKPCSLLRVDQYCIIILKLKIFYTVCVLYYTFYISVLKFSPHRSIWIIEIF